MQSRPIIGTSSCILGQSVRFNGGHLHDREVTGNIGQHFDFFPVCPEMAAGMGVPRPAIRLVKREQGIRAEYSDGSGTDVTDDLMSASDRLMQAFNGLDGFIVAKKSPSCGMGGVKIYHANGHPDGSGAGIFTRMLRERFPHLPVEDNGRLNDDVLRENFISRVLIHHDWRTVVMPELSAKVLLDFHTRHKFLVMSHSNMAYRRLGKMLSDLAGKHLPTLADAYFADLMQTLAIPATRSSHSNVLQHLQGYVKDFMSPSERQSLSEAIHEYRVGHVPLIVPVTLLRCFARDNAERTRYLRNQSYLAPYPSQLRLRNGI